MNTPQNPQRFRRFVAGFTALVTATQDEKRIHSEGKVLLADIVQNDDWLPDACAQPHPQYYQQYLLHCDPLERFSVLSFVWGPGQKTPVHNHTVWGMYVHVEHDEWRAQHHGVRGQDALVLRTPFERTKLIIKSSVITSKRMSVVL